MTMTLAECCTACAAAVDSVTWWQILLLVGVILFCWVVIAILAFIILEYL